VFAQPIGHDTIYSFDVAADQIDLIGFGNIASFADIQAHTTNDANGNAVIVFGDGESITVMGINAGSLTVGNFLFDQIPVTNNAATMTLSDGALLPLGGTVDNTGTIALNAAGNQTDLEILASGATLQGGGHVTLSDSSANVIVGSTAESVLTNVDNIISGAGQLGAGQLTLINEIAGVIDANAMENALVIDTGSNSVWNYGTIEATDGGSLEITSGVGNFGYLVAAGGSTMLIDGAVENSGTIETSGTLQIAGAVTGTGTAQIDSGGILEFHSLSAVNVIFANDSGTTGVLVLFDSLDFSGLIFGFAGDGTLANSDLIDLKDVNFGNVATDSTTYVDKGDGTGMLTLYSTDGVMLSSLTFVGDYQLENFTIESDGKGGTFIVDPPVTSSTADPDAPAPADDVSSDIKLIEQNGSNPVDAGLAGGEEASGQEDDGWVANSRVPEAHHDLHEKGMASEQPPLLQDQGGLFGELMVDQSLSFNFASLHTPLSNSHGIGNLDHLDENSSFHLEIAELRSLIEDVAGMNTHDPLSHMQDLSNVDAQVLTKLQHHDVGLYP
jgi:hypothetical protein